MKTECPFCGSENISESEVTKKTGSKFGTIQKYQAVENECVDCGGRGDFSEQNPARIENALQKSKEESAIKILESLSQNGASNAYIERALRLPIRTISRWKGGGISTPSYTLLRIVHQFNWLLDVVDSDFNQKIVRHYIFEQAANYLGSALDEKPRAQTVTLAGRTKKTSVTGTIFIGVCEGQSVEASTAPTTISLDGTL